VSSITISHTLKTRRDQSGVPHHDSRDELRENFHQTPKNIQSAELLLIDRKQKIQIEFLEEEIFVKGFSICVLPLS
jgi:hypothetical protein